MFSALPHLRRSIATTSSCVSRRQYTFSALFDSNHLNLPRLPIPPLEDTLRRYEQSITPLCVDDKELQQTRATIDQFRKSGGAELHAALVAQDQAQAAEGTFPHFYFEDLWDSAYLDARCPNPVNISPTFFMPTTPKKGSQSVRAAELLSAAGRWLVHAREGRLQPDGLDMSRLGLIMGTARLPGQKTDTLKHYGEVSTHVVVQRRSGEFHKVEILTPDGKTALSAAAIQAALDSISAASSSSSSSTSTSTSTSSSIGVGVLTSLPREEWYHARQHLLTSDVTGTNEKTLAEIDSALLMVALDDLDAGNDLTKYCRAGLHGVDTQTRTDKWWDKHQLIVDPSGRVGLQFEHSFSDGLSWNRWLGEIWHAMDYMETPKKWKYGHLSNAADPSVKSMTKQLEWKIDDMTRKTMEHADNVLQTTLCNNVDTVASTFNGFGKSQIKQMGYSPDAFVQMSYQLAYARLHDGQPAATYEACSTAAHFHGRTETIRSCSMEARKFVQSFLKVDGGGGGGGGGGGVAGEEQKMLLGLAAKQQSTLSREAASGMGVDRHLMSLKHLADKNGNESMRAIFEDPLYGRSSTWKLSTSNVAAPWLAQFGFGPTAENGFGLGYQILDDSVPIHVTSWKSSTETVSSQKMFDGICEAMDSMKKLH